MEMQPYGSYSPSLAIDFIAQEEGRRLKAYKCSAGCWTIGYGHTEGVKEGDEITASEADQLLLNDTTNVVVALAKYINVPVTQGMFVALTSLAFNLGVNGLVTKCPKLMRALNAGEYEAAAKEFLDVTGGGPGLVGRRKREAKKFLEGLE